MTKPKTVDDSEITMTEDYEYLYQGEPFTGIAVEYYEGFLLGEENYRDGMLHGLAKRWHLESEQLASLKSYENNAVVGVRKEWYESGQLKLEEEIEEGIALRRTVWDQFGDVVEEYRVEEDEDPFLYELLQLKRSRR